LLGGARVRAQNPGAQPAAPTPRASAPIDLTGYWVSVVNEDWRFRMVTPAKGDYKGVPITREALQIVNAWNPAADEAAGNQCKSYGAAAIMRVPGRIHVTWQDDNTLKIETDAGTQTRLFQFGALTAPPAQPTWQGQSLARWERPGRGNPAVKLGSLAVTTTNMRAGYLRKNGVPYSENAIVSEYIDRLGPEPDGAVYLLIRTTVDDPKYLTQPFVTSTHFRLEADGAAKWHPAPCKTDPPALAK
jgi:hypothetical protein